ncbi:MAG: hypothetical protein RLZZ67_606 [Candidatus Parcubacteria bacterium]|jgi:hypothetical protein
MKALFTIILLVSLAVVPALGQTPQTVRLLKMFPFDASAAVAPVTEGPLVILDTYKVNDREPSWNTIRLVRELENRFDRRRDTGPVEVVPDNPLLSRVTDEHPVIGSFTGRSSEFRQLQGGYRVNFGGAPTTLYFKSGVRWHLEDDPNTMIIVRASRFASVAVERKFRNEHDIFKPVKVILRKLGNLFQ